MYTVVCTSPDNSIGDFKIAVQFINVLTIINTTTIQITIPIIPIYALVTYDWAFNICLLDTASDNLFFNPLPNPPSKKPINPTIDVIVSQIP